MSVISNARELAPPAARRGALGVVLALAAGIGVGYLDLGASDVQGPLLVCMLAAFAIALGAAAPAWLVGAVVALGIPIAHAIWSAIGSAAPPSAAMLIALVPTIAAAYGGRAAGLWIARAARDVPELPPARALIGVALSGCALVGALPVYATLRLRDQPVAWWVTTWWQAATFVGWCALAPTLLRQSRRITERRVTPRLVGTVLTTLVGLVALHALVLAALTVLLRVPTGAASLASVAAWAMGAYLPTDLLLAALLAAVAYASDTRRRERALDAALSESRLGALRAQLRPHFLFNALNAATVLVRRGDARGASDVLDALADLLRAVLDDRSPTVPLEEELRFATRYLDVERVRFGDRLRVILDVPAAALAGVRVPHLILQPLVENAVHHGVGARASGGTIAIRAARDGDRLTLVVEDDGPGIDSDAATRTESGVGLANTRARLSALYGEAGTLVVARRADGGTVARVTLPITQER